MNVTTNFLRLAVFALLASFAMLDVALASEVIGDVKVEPGAPGSVVLRWRTDVATGSRVAFGLAADALTQHAEGDLTVDHAVTLSGLSAGQKYFYSVGTARKKLATGSFTTQGSPVSSPKTTPSTSPKRPVAPVPQTSPTTKAAVAPLKAPPARATWGNIGSLPDHFARHGPDFRARDAEDYAAQAWTFRQRALAGAFAMKLDTDGVLRVFDNTTGAFAAYNRDGTTKTYFKPGSRDYFARQPGRPVTPRDLPTR